MIGLGLSIPEIAMRRGGSTVTEPVFAALVPAEDGTVTLQAKGAGAPTFARASTALVETFDGTYVECATDEARFAGARRVSEGVWSWKDASDNSLHPTRFLAGQRLFAFYAERNAANNSIEFEVGDRIWATATDGLRYYYECTTAGTSGTSPPVFPTSGTVTDGGVVWTYGGLYRFKGLLLEPAATNLFLNSDSPATQTITITATGNYTVSVIGTGSATSSDNTATSTGHGAASAGSPRTFNVTATGTVDITISGTPTYVQVEAGAVPTSPIVTAGSAVTRATEAGGLDYAGANLDATVGTVMATVHYPSGAGNQGGTSGVTSTRLADQGLSVQSGPDRNEVRAVIWDGTNISNTGGGDVRSDSPGTPFFGASRWGTGMGSARKIGRGAAAGSSGAFNGTIQSADMTRFADVIPASGIQIANFLIFDRDLGQPWIQANV